MASIPRPNPEFAPVAHTILTVGTPAAKHLAAQLVKAANAQRVTWRLHQRNCEPCAAVPEDEYCGPACQRGFRIWNRWQEAESKSKGLGSLLRDDDPPAAVKPSTADLTLF